MKISPEARGYLADLVQAGINGIAAHAMETLVTRPVRHWTPQLDTPPPAKEPIYRPSSGCPWCDVSDFLALADKNLRALRVVPIPMKPYFVKLVQQHLDAALGMIAVTNIRQLRDLRTPILHVLAELQTPIVAEQGLVSTALNPINRMIEVCALMSVTFPNQMPAHLDTDFLITDLIKPQGATNGHHEPINASFAATNNPPGGINIGVRDARTDQAPR